MTVNVGTMQLPVPEDPDAVRTYLNGTHVSGGLWTSLTRASNHDHSGGLNGIQLTATSIPDGSITGAKLDPSVLLPYALVDGSKPFTGIVTMNADQLIRDTLRFGAKPAGVADATLARTGAGALRVDTHLGVGVNPAAWATGWRALQAGRLASLASNDAVPWSILTNNSYSTASTSNALIADAASRVFMNGATIQLETAPSVAAGAAQTFTTRASIAPTGALSLTPDAGAAVLLAGSGTVAVPWSGNYRAVQVGRAGVILGPSDGNGLFETDNLYHDGAAWKAINAGTGSMLQLSGGGLGVYTANAPGSGNAVALSQRIALAPTGTLSLSPDAGVPSIAVPNWTIRHPVATVFDIQYNASGTPSFRVDASGDSRIDGVFRPGADNAWSIGSASFRWTNVYASNGAIQTSSAAVKEDITPLDPAACYQAAKDVRWYEYTYLPPVYREPEPSSDVSYDASDDNETKAEKKAMRGEFEAASKAAHLKMVAETAPARHQRGFVFPAGAESKDEAGGALPPVPDLFGLSDRESTTPQADLATLGCALQEVIRRLEALEAPN